MLTSLIIDTYAKHSILYDDNECNRKQRHEALLKITKCINAKFNLRLQWKSMAIFIKQLRFKYRTELLNQNTAQKKGDLYKSSWYFEKLTFLKPYIQFKERNKRVS